MRPVYLVLLKILDNKKREQIKKKKFFILTVTMYVLIRNGCETFN